MSRLYAWINSERSEKTITANQILTIKINYGSSSNSQKAAYITVTYPKGSEHPIITLEEGDQGKLGFYRSKNP